MKTVVIRVLAFGIGFIAPFLIFQNTYAIDSCDSYPSADYSGTTPATYNGQVWYSPSIDYFNACVGPTSGVEIGPNYAIVGGDELKVWKYYVETAGTCSPGDTYMRAKRATYDLSATQCEYVPPDPETWTNGVKDPDEDGIDCGGANPATCVESCPDGKDSYVITDLDVTVCGYSIPPDSMGDCPSAYGFLVDGKCFDVASTSEPILAAEVINLPNNEDYTPPENPWNEITTQKDTTIEQTTATDPDGTEHDITTTTNTSTDTEGNSSSETTVVDTAYHPDGSKTVTTTVTGSTDGSGDSDSTGYSKTTTQEYDSDGNLTSESEEETEQAADDNLGGLPVVVDAQPGLEFGPLIAVKDKGLQRFPISLINSLGSLVDGWVMDPVAPSWSLTLPNPMVGADFQFDIDLHMMDPYVEVLRDMLKIFIVVCFSFIIIRRWTS